MKNLIALLVLSCSIPLFGASAFARKPAVQPPPYSVFGELKTHVPNRPTFVIYGTLPVVLQQFHRDACPFSIVAPDGTILDTQWELVARLRDRLIVELRAVVHNQWSGHQLFQVIDRPSPYSAGNFDPSLGEMVRDPNAMRLRLLDQGGVSHELAIAGIPRTSKFHRVGPVTVTVQRNFETEYGGFQIWYTYNRDEQDIELIINWNNGTLPARPDVFFRTLELDLKPGWSFTPLLPDPAVSPPYLVRADDHILPQRMERSFRIIVHPSSQPPDLTSRGFAVGTWWYGGYMAQGIALPNLSHAAIDLSVERGTDYFLLMNNLPTSHGQQPVSFLWPAQGDRYGGMTSGFHIEQFPAVPLAVSGQPAGLQSLYVEQLRYASRHMSCIYRNDGEPIRLDDYLNSDGSAPWQIYNCVFLGNPVADAPFRFSQTGPGTGTSSYDPRVFEPIDCQHLVRRTKANKALMWLANDPLAKLYLTMDAEIGRMTFYEGRGGLLQVPMTPGLGWDGGRAEAWVGDLMATVFSISNTEWRVRSYPWISKFVEVLRESQMPSGLFGAIGTGRIAEAPPYGDGTTAYYYAHRTNEQVYLMLALRGIQEVTGTSHSTLIADAGTGLWQLAWKPNSTGVLDRYPAGPIHGPRYVTSAEFPPGLTDSVPGDHWQVCTALGIAYEAGADMHGAIQAHAQASNLADALVNFESWGLDDIANRANTLAILQKLLP